MTATPRPQQRQRQTVQARPSGPPAPPGRNGIHSSADRSAGRERAARNTAPPGFRGTWTQFHARLPLLSLSLLALLAAPPYLWRAEINGLLAATSATVATQYTALASLALLPAAVLSVGLYRRARRRSEFARALFVLERVARAAVAAGLMSLLASLGAGLLLGRGSVLAGDWLLLPSFWVVAFAVSLRFVGPRRP